MLFVVGFALVVRCDCFGVSDLSFVVFVIVFLFCLVCGLWFALRSLVLLWFAACLRLFCCLCVLLFGCCACDLFVCRLVVTDFCLLFGLVILFSLVVWCV